MVGLPAPNTDQVAGRRMNATPWGKISGMTRSDVGSDRDSPRQIPVRGWWQVLGRAIRQSREDNIPHPGCRSGLLSDFSRYFGR
jgi:hypothetical protein